MAVTRKMAGAQDVRVQVRVAGAVPAELPDLARQKVEAVLRHVGEPVLAARVLLAIAPDPAVARPAMASGTVSVNGRVVRAEVGADTMRNAIDQLASRLRVRLERARPSRPDCGPDSRRHGPARALAKAGTGERVIRAASVAAAAATPATAARELGLLGYDFYLFTDELSGQDSVIYRTPDGYKIDSARPFGGRVVSSAPTAAVAPASRITISDHAAPRLSVPDAISRLEYLGESFMFFVDAATGRGSVLYRRLDGHYGLVAPAAVERQLRM
jgi:ribosome-associated translation inhibitor RaiA